MIKFDLSMNTINSNGISMPEFPADIDNLRSDLLTSFLMKRETALVESIKKAGCTVNDVILIVAEGDKFEHYYVDFGKPTEKRLLSVEKLAEFSCAFDLRTNTFNFEVSARCF